MVRSYDSTSRTTPREVRAVVVPSAVVAVTEPPKLPSAVPARVSAVTVAVASPPAGTVSCCGETVNRPSAAGFPSSP
ncbi:hypothetical protein ACRJ4B_18895 [Streptomyces sp. GTA36]